MPFRSPSRCTVRNTRAHARKMLTPSQAIVPCNARNNTRRPMWWPTATWREMRPLLDSHLENCPTHRFRKSFGAVANMWGLQRGGSQTAIIVHHVWTPRVDVYGVRLSESSRHLPRNRRLHHVEAVAKCRGGACNFRTVWQAACPSSSPSWPLARVGNKTSRSSLSSPSNRSWFDKRGTFASCYRYWGRRSSTRSRTNDLMLDGISWYST